MSELNYLTKKFLDCMNSKVDVNMEANGMWHKGKALRRIEMEVPREYRLTKYDVRQVIKELQKDGKIKQDRR